MKSTKKKKDRPGKNGMSPLNMNVFGSLVFSSEAVKEAV